MDPMANKKNRIIAKEFCLVKPLKFGVRERVIKSVPEHFLLLKPIVAGICGSEMLYFKGEKEKEKLEKRLPMCLLHEGVAKILKAGEGTRLKTGAYVVVNPMIPCKECFACRYIGENLCPNARYMAATADGLARTFLVYPEERVLPLPAGIEPEVAALTEPLSVALNAFEVSEVRSGEMVAVIGDGTVGYLVALVASFVGGIPLENLYLIGVIDQKLSLARDFASTLNSVKEQEEMKRLAGRFDVIFEAAGGRAHKLTISEAIDLLRPGGRCIMLGISKGEVPVGVTEIVNKGLTFRGSTRSRMDHCAKVLDSLRQDGLRQKVKRVISERSFTINTAEDLEEAFRYADTEEGEARTKPGRVLVYFPS